MIISFSDPYNLAIKTQNSNISYSAFYKQNDIEKYYQLKYLSLLDSQPYLEEHLVYDEDTYEYIYTFDDEYVLVMSNKTYSFLSTLYYVKFEIDENQAIGYMTDLSRTDMTMVLYSNLTIPLLSLYVFGSLLYFYIENGRKAKRNQK